MPRARIAPLLYCAWLVSMSGVAQLSSEPGLKERALVLMEQGRVLGDDNRGIVIGFEASVNIDTEWDFLLAEVLLREGRAPIGTGRA